MNERTDERVIPRSIAVYGDTKTEGISVCSSDLMLIKCAHRIDLIDHEFINLSHC